MNGDLPSMRHCSERRTQDINMAKKLAFVAVSDFLCWFPIGIMGILSLIGSVFSFPLKSCSTDSQILFVIDCRHEVREQIDFINQTVDYLRYNKNWTSLNVSYMIHEDKEPTSLEVLTSNITKKANEISNQCNTTISINDLFLKTKLAMGIKHSILKLNVIFLNLDNGKMELTQEIADKQDDDDENNRFFILTNAVKNQISPNYFYYAKSFKDLNIFNVFPKICDLKCTDTNLTFVSQDFQKSFYRVEYKNISHKEGVEYCDKKYNSYLISIETYEELDYLINMILKKHLLSNVLKSVYLHLGLVKKPYRDSFWSSGNPFTFYHNLQQLETPQCLYLVYNTNISDTSTFKNNKSIWRYLNLIDCDQIKSDTYIVCECHQQLQTEVDWEFSLLNQPDTVGFLKFYLSLYGDFSYYFNGRRDLLSVNCTDARYTPYDENNYFCKKTNLVPSIHTYVRSSYVKRENNTHCYSKCIGYYTLNSGSEVNADIAISESYCYRTYECPSNIVNVPKDLSVVPCQSYVDSSLKCLKLRFKLGCIDNSHLENCEHFQCPDGFIKCPRSYCIPLLSFKSNERQCPLGQEKTIFARRRRICYAKISLKIKDICINSNLARFSFICNENCPTGYSCVSYRAKDNLTRFLQEYIVLYNVSNSLIPFDSYLYLTYLQIIEIKVQNCKIQNVDKALRHWEKTQTVILDLSRNQISNSDDLRSVTSMTTLLFLNLSSNILLRINDKFEFPHTLEVIDLSYTSVESLPENIFGPLHSLRMLDLSYTKIHKFENMGLPSYFTLDILNIVGVMMTEITADFYQGLTVNTSLMSSYFKLCCPQILGKNIPSGKCHAPDDAISSCKHIVGDTLKRILVWVVGLLTIAGNGIVLFYKVVGNREKIFQTAFGLFVTGLAVSDLLMGVYLMIIAVVDVVYADVYVVAQETSKSLKWKGFISTWVIGFVVALTPAVVPEWQIYSSNGLCLALPLSTTGSYKLPGWEFSMAVYVILNFVLFLFIALGQLGIFVNVIKKRNLPSMRHCSEKRTQDMNIAKKLAFVAVSDFLCWFPIGIMGILSLIGQEFDKETYAWMAVFVLPVNSALNPMIYTIPVIVDKLTSKN
ncbi:hypothetical protein Btru_008365 [Bulinus truncatus]|nr:hypothetical protein Btru_008365 [Bulinus truncatus]